MGRGSPVWMTTRCRVLVAGGNRWLGSRQIALEDRPAGRRTALLRQRLELVDLPPTVEPDVLASHVYSAIPKRGKTPLMWSASISVRTNSFKGASTPSCAWRGCCGRFGAAVDHDCCVSALGCRTRSTGSRHFQPAAFRCGRWSRSYRVLKRPEGRRPHDNGTGAVD